MFAIEREILREMTNDLEIAAFEEEFVNEVDDILEDYALGLDTDEINILGEGFDDEDDIQLEDYFVW